MKGVKFLRRNWFRHKRLGLKWRRPRGSQNKLRKEKKGKGRVPKIGWKKPDAERGKIPYKGNYIEVDVIRRAEDLKEGMKYVIVASGVGLKKLVEIYERAKELGIEIVNKKKLVAMFERLKSLRKKNKEVDKKPESSDQDSLGNNEEGGSNES